MNDKQMKSVKSSDPLLTVVVPVYNMQDTLARCVKSVLGQNVAGLQVVIVDDGSSDGSAAVADRFAGRAGVTVVYRANGGLSAARNTGLRYARGRYVTFVDADDWVAPGTYRQLLALLADDPDCDILEYSLEKDSGQSVTRVSLSDQVYSDPWQYWLEGRAYQHTYACNKLFRRQLFSTVQFAEGRRFEDVWCLADMLHVAHRVRTTSTGGYHYVVNPEGITCQADGRGWRDLLEGHLRVLGDTALWQRAAFADYYARVLNIQLYTYALTGDRADIRLPRLRSFHTLKLCLLQLLGLRHLCRLARWFYRRPTKQ